MKFKRFATVVVAMGLGLTAVAVPSASAAPTRDPGPPPIREDLEFSLEAGQGCAFALDVSGTGAKARVKEFDNGLTITSGKGFLLTYTNTDADRSVSFESNGSVERRQLNSDGETATVTVTGHNAITLFPGDVIDGEPLTVGTTVLYTGRVVYTEIIDTQQFIVTSHSGAQQDICGLLD